MSQVKVARLALSSSKLPRELPPRQGDPRDKRVWVYFWGQDLGEYIRDQLESALLQCGGSKVGGCLSKGSQIYF